MVKTAGLFLVSSGVGHVHAGLVWTCSAPLRYYREVQEEARELGPREKLVGIARLARIRQGKAQLHSNDGASNE